MGRWRGLGDSGPTLAYPGGVLAEPNIPLQIEGGYETPKGFRDFPFVYMYDASPLTNGQNAFGQRVLMDGTSDFILRAIFGFAHILSGTDGKFQFKNYWGSYASSAPFRVAQGTAGVIAPITTTNEFGTPVKTLRNPDVWQVVPEKRYPYDSQITFDLYDVDKTGSVNYDVRGLSVMGFMGVKRRPAWNYCLYETPYKYKEVPFCYTQDVTVSTRAVTASGAATPGVIQQINVSDYDFELQRILVGVTSSFSLINDINQFSMILYDASGEPTSNLPVPFHYITDQGLGAGGTGTQFVLTPTGLVFPCPPLIYPNQSRMRFDIFSNIARADAHSSYTFQVVFQGVQRLPCT